MIDNPSNAPPESMLTTIDNPYNPFTQFDEWYAFDVSKGYYTCAYLARVTKTSDSLSDLDESLAIEAAIDSIIDLNIIGLYTKVTKENFLNMKV
jgi:hypothetical protein